MSCLNCREDLQTHGHVHCVECETASVDLCFVCFADRAEIGNCHKANHKYVVIPPDAYAESEICPGWSEIELLSLLDSTRMSGVGNFFAAARQVKTKSPKECEECFARLFEQHEISDHHPLQGRQIVLHGVSERQTESEMQEISGFLPKRGEFDVEFDDGAELMLADLEISEEDIGNELELKLDVLNAYTERLRERGRVKKLAIDHFLTKHKKFPLSIYEQEISDRIQPAARFFDSAHELAEFVQLCVAERRLQEQLNPELIPSDFRTSKKHAAIIDKARKLNDAVKRTDTKEKLAKLLMTENPTSLSSDVLALLKTTPSHVHSVPGSQVLFQVSLAE